ncbi:hypothetical protein Trydic_g8124 [Trypoxylus dichotomus]
MKCVLVALVAVLAVASASVYAPSVYSLGSPYAYSAYAPYAYAAPLPYSVAPVAVAGTGYVAATRGSLHTAPLPEGPLASSLHINTAPAPGTL